MILTFLVNHTGRNYCRTIAFLLKSNRLKQGDARTIRKKSSEKKHEHRKEESVSIATSMSDTRVGSWKNLFGRRNSPMRAKQFRPQNRSFTGNWPWRSHPAWEWSLRENLCPPRPGRASFLKKRNAEPFALENHATRVSLPKNSYESP